jgi:hypothetical protein
MDVYLDDKKIGLNWGFPEKISQLKKRDTITLELCYYIYDNIVKSGRDLEFLQHIKEVPENIYVSKSNYYWWVFEGCKLIDKKIEKDKNFHGYNGRDVDKWNCKLTFSYGDVYGSNKKSVVERDLKLKKLFSE